MRHRTWQSQPARQALGVVTNAPKVPGSLVASSKPLPQSQVEVGVKALHKILSNYLILGRYWVKWRASIGTRERNKRLLRIRRDVLISLTTRCMSKWRRQCHLSKGRRDARCLATTCETLLQSRYFWKFVGFAFKARQRRYACSVLALWNKQLTRNRLFERWSHWRSLSRRACEMRVAAMKKWSAVTCRRAFQLWCRQSRRSKILDGLRTLCRRALRQQIRHIFAQWELSAVNKLRVSRVEQTNLRRVACRYLAKWSEARCVIPQQRLIDQARAAGRMRCAYTRWVRWLMRIVQAYQLEQRRHVVLLQRYYVRWRVLHDAGFLKRLAKPPLAHTRLT